MNQQHGHYEYEIDSRVLIIDAYGPWNDDAAESFERVGEVASRHFWLLLQRTLPLYIIY